MSDVTAMIEKMKPQNDELDAVAELAKQYRRISMTPIVDDDYPEVRYDYERAMRSLVERLRANGRLGKGE